MRRSLFGVADPRGDGDSEIREVRSTFDDAVEAWEELRKKESGVHFHINGWNHGTIASFSDVRDLFAQPSGTDHCPICLVASPHSHTAQEVFEYRDHQRVMAEIHERRRAEILRIARHIENTYGYPREAVAGDFGLTETVSGEHG